AALAERGRRPGDHRVGIIRSILVSEDAQADWQIVRAAESYRMQLYKQFFADSGEGFGEAGETIPQTWIVGDADHCVAEITAFVEAYGITDIVTMAVPPGLRAEQMNASLERLFSDVAPRVKRALGEG
ncbi:MAG: hypothetical protein ACU85U_15950, partial [Gammaproteobacteria bacterium]